MIPSDSEIFLDGYDYAIDHPTAPSIPPAEIGAIRPESAKDGLPSTSHVWMNGWRAGTRRRMDHGAIHEFGHHTGWCPFCGISVSDTPM
jgi:hypothetical protein